MPTPGGDSARPERPSGPGSIGIESKDVFRPETAPTNPVALRQVVGTRKKQGGAQCGDGDDHQRERVGHDSAHRLETIPIVKQKD